MGYDLGNAVGRRSRDQPVAWTRTDIVTYTLGVGTKHDDLSLVDEPDKSWGPLPTYLAMLGLKGDGPGVTFFADKASREAPPVLTMDVKRMLQGAQSIEVLKDIPVESGPGWKISRRVVGIHENKSGIVVDNEAILLDPHGTPHAKLHSSSFFVGSKANGEKFSKVVVAVPQAKPVPKDQKPDWIIRDKTSPAQALIYRQPLIDDYDPLHIDQLSGVILRGLFTFGFMARGLIQAIAKGDSRALKVFGVRFTSPVRPGDELETSVWEVGPGPNGTTEITFITKDLTSGKVVLSNGVAFIKKVEKSKL